MQVKEEKLFNYFYKITNLINGKFYYGIRSSNKLHSDKYMGSGLALLEAFKKYGIENFKKEIINHYPTRFEASEHERMIVDLEMINDPQCYNCRTGGQNGYIRIISNETRKKLSISNKGKKISEKQKQQLSIKAKEQMKDPSQRFRLAEQNKNKEYTNEYRERLSKSHLGKQVPIETKIKISRTQKELGCRNKKCIINGIEYKSAKDCDIALNLNVGTTSARILSNSKTFVEWQYLENENYNQTKPPHQKSCKVDGIVFNSLACATRTLKIDYSTLIRRLDSTNIEFSNWIRLDNLSETI